MTTESQIRVKACEVGSFKRLELGRSELSWSVTPLVRFNRSSLGRSASARRVLAGTLLLLLLVPGYFLYYRDTGKVLTLIPEYLLGLKLLGGFF
jgi:hypothetical protein